MAHFSLFLCFMLGTLASAQITPPGDSYTNTGTPTTKRRD
jgi:hypothetical protein